MPLRKLDAIDDVEELSAIPSLLMELMTLLNDPSTRQPVLVEKIKQDAALTAFLLKYCNSSLFSSRLKINRVEHALSMIGIPRCKSIMMSYIMRNLYRNAGNNPFTSAIWEHSILVALIAREVTLFIGKEAALAEDAYTAGLLHDIGKLAIYLLDKEDYEELYVVTDTEKDLVTREKEFYGFNHSEAGNYLMKGWEFSEILSEPALYHHHIADYKGILEVTGLVAFANAAFHDSVSSLIPMNPFLLELYGLDNAKYQEFMEGIGDTLQAAASLKLF